MMEKDILLEAYRLMCTADAMATIYEANRNICTYVHSTSRGHEAIQLATAFQLLPCDYVSPYYRDESLLLGLGFSPYQLMLQLLAKKDDIFSGGREYYSHPSSRDKDKPTIIHQSSATGMQVIPATGIAQGLQYLEKINSPIYRNGENAERPIVICSLGDASLTEGEVSEALQVAALKQLPIIYLVQDNNWGISVTASEARSMNAYQYIKGFKGIKRVCLDGSDFFESYKGMRDVVREVRETSQPYLVHAEVPLLGHHTSGVRKEFYRTDEELEKSLERDPFAKLKLKLLHKGFSETELNEIETAAKEVVNNSFNEAVASAEPDPAD
ncbi:MAG: thiamine pyrophosphate-dependent dehydrogenase E1 component subunit alpha, partial [Ginsengibacter sp.]